MTTKSAEKKLDNIIKNLKSSTDLSSKPKKMLVSKTKFIKLANEVKKIFEEEERERRLSAT